jgi:hypothetical protein
LDEERKVKEEKAKELMRRKEAVRNLSLVSEERAPGHAMTDSSSMSLPRKLRRQVKSKR